MMGTFPIHKKVPMQSAINWFEIPCADMDRAQTFYETVLGRTLQRENFGGQVLAVFPYDKPACGGCLQAGANGAASAGTGIRIYLDCSPSLDAVLGRIAQAGGDIVVGKTALPPGMGVIAHICDTEGNHVGLHCAG
jgi:uncharacterized protein